jgi:serine/threonine protein kinase
MSSKANVLITDDGIPCLSDIGMNNRLLKVTYNNAWPVPSGWVFKAPEELFLQCDPAVFRNTKAMDVYSFACTVFTVSLYAELFDNSAFVYPCRPQIFTSKPPFSPRPYGKGMKEKMAGAHSIGKPAEMSNLMWSLLQRCLSYNPDHRPSMAVVESELMMM